MTMIRRFQIAAASLIVAISITLTPGVAAQSEKSNRMQPSSPAPGLSGQGPAAPDRRPGATPHARPGASGGGEGNTPRANPGDGPSGCPYRNDRPLHLLV